MNQQFIKTTDLLTSKEMFALCLDLYGKPGAEKEREAVRERLVIRLCELEATAGNTKHMRQFNCSSDQSSFIIYAANIDAAIIEARDYVREGFEVLESVTRAGALSVEDFKKY